MRTLRPPHAPLYAVLGRSRGLGYQQSIVGLILFGGHQVKGEARHCSFGCIGKLDLPPLDVQITRNSLVQVCAMAIPVSPRTVERLRLITCSICDVSETAAGIHRQAKADQSRRQLSVPASRWSLHSCDLARPAVLAELHFIVAQAYLQALRRYCHCYRSGDDQRYVLLACVTLLSTVCFKCRVLRATGTSACGQRYGIEGR